jgi:imidazolonepropionase-like amidohydrolase
MKNLQRSVMVVVAVTALASQNIAQQASRSIVLHAGHALDVKSGKLLADQTFIIEDGKIVSAGASEEMKVPADAVRIDLPNATVLPGLIDAHTT